MKTKILTIIMLAAMLSGYANNKNEAPASPPTHVIDYIKYMRQWYGDKDNLVYMRAINPDDNSLRSSVEVIPFQCPKDKGIMTKFKRAFFEDIDLAYHFTQAMPGQLGGWVVGIGDYKDQEMYTRDRTEQEHIAMWVKNAKNPEMRDYYGVVWDYKSDVIKGKIFIIYSRREDLQKDRNNSNSQEQNDNFFNSQKEKINETLLKINPEENVEEWWKDWNEKNGIKNKSLSSVPSIPSVPKGNAKVEEQLQAYKDLLEMQEEEIQKLRRDYDRDDLKPEERTLIKQRILKLHKQAQRTTDKIGKLISKVR